LKVLLLQLDGKIPNIALMRIAAHHRTLGDDVELRWTRDIASVAPELFARPDRVYASLIFERTRPVAEALLRTYPDALVGGTGWDVGSALEKVGITTTLQDYSIYPTWRQSIGFTQRGCRLKCPFCVVPKKEGDVKPELSIYSLWRGGTWPRELILLDNDFFGQPEWEERIHEMREGGFKVSFNQGINARFLTPETAAAVASVDYRDDSMKERRIYTAWDNSRDEDRLFRGLEALASAGVKPDHIMVYILLGYWPWSDIGDWEKRRSALRKFGARPYPMPYERTPQAVGFQRWVIGAYDKRISWEAWERAGYRPERVGLNAEAPLFNVSGEGL
jgi:hypothetical protein